MSSSPLGKNSSNKKKSAEILNFSPYGIWILVSDKEYFIDFDRYPDFLAASLEQIRNFEATGFDAISGLHWPDIDVDIELIALEYPERYPLVAKTVPNRRKKIKARSKQTAGV